MSAKITYDKNSGFGYVRILNAVPGGIKQTVDLQVSDCLLLDLDKKGRIIGIEFFRGKAYILQDAIEQDRGFEKTGDSYTLQLQQKKVAVTFRQAGIAFHFAGADYTDLAAIEIEDRGRYDAK